MPFRSNRWTSSLPEYQEVEAFLSPNFAPVTAFAGFHPPKGWLGLVKKIHSRLVASEPDYVLYQVKEKFGRLCYYADITDQSNIDYVKAMEDSSTSLCQNCGQRGVLRQAPIAVMCDDCYSDGSTGYFY